MPRAAAVKDGPIWRAQAEEDRMKTIVLAMVAGAGTLLITSLQAPATPADGAAIATIGRQVNPVTNVATKKGHRCRPDYTRDRNGYCRFNTHTL
jgi:hypothetical protein